MKAIVIFITLLVLTIVQLGYGSLELKSHTLPSPFFAWSEKPYFHQRSSTSSLDATQITEFVLSAANNLRNKFLNNEEIALNKPEAILIFTQSKISSMDISHSYDNSFANLKRLVESNVNTFSDAYANVRDLTTIPQYLAGSFDQLESKGSLIVSAENSVKWAKTHFVPLEQLTQTLNEKKELFNNDITDIIIVLFSGEIPSQDDARLAEINSQVKQLTNGNYIAVFTSASAVESNRAYLREEEEGVAVGSINDFLRERYEIYGVRQTPSNNTNHGQTGYFPNYVWEGLILSFVLLFFLFFVFCCMMGIQTPDRFEGGQKRNIIKERAH